MTQLIPLLQDIQNCQTCGQTLPFAPKPVLQAHASAQLLIIGQAPGLKVQETGIPWHDASGRRLRQWLQMSEEIFYTPEKVAIMPMGFCYPGKGKSGDLPPRKECAPQWHDALLKQLPNIKLILLVGQYAQQYYLKGSEFAKRFPTLKEKVHHSHQCPAPYFCLPHPSPRNLAFSNAKGLSQHPWFEAEVLPQLQQKIKTLFA